MESVSVLKNKYSCTFRCANCNEDLGIEQPPYKQCLLRDKTSVVFSNSNFAVELCSSEDDDKIKTLAALSKIFLPSLWDVDSPDLISRSEEDMQPWEAEDFETLKLCTHCLCLVTTLYKCFSQLNTLASHSDHSLVLKKLARFLTLENIPVEQIQAVNIIESIDQGQIAVIPDVIEVEEVNSIEVQLNQEPSLLKCPTIESTLDPDSLKVQECLNKRPSPPPELMGTEIGKNDFLLDTPEVSSSVQKRKTSQLNTNIKNGRSRRSPRKRKSKGRICRAQKALEGGCCILCPTTFRSQNEFFDHFLAVHDIFRKGRSQLESVHQNSNLSIGERDVKTKDLFNKAEEDLDVDMSESIDSTELASGIVVNEEDRARLTAVSDLTTEINSNPLYFKCNLCEETISARNAYIHLSSIHCSFLDVPYPCDCCNHKFHTETGLEEHKPYHEGKKGYACEECGRSYCTSLSVKKHIERFHDVCHSFLCNSCNKAFTSDRDLRLHCLKKHESNARDYKCSHCNKSYRTKLGRDAHEKRIHENAFPYNCLNCETSFTTRKELVQHNKENHSKRNKAVPYSLLDQETKRKKMERMKFLGRERRTQQRNKILNQFCSPVVPPGSENDVQPNLVNLNDMKMLKCNVCTCVCPPKLMMLHIDRSHSELFQDPHVCDICGKRSFSKTALQVHIRTVHNNNTIYSCEHCGKEFRCKSSCKSHIATVHENIRYFCPKCGKCFTTETRLKMHQKTHEGLQPVMDRHYSCPYEGCGRKFHRQNLYLDHIDLHTGEKRHSCHMCGAKFRHGGTLHGHIKSVHQGIKRHLRKKSEQDSGSYYA